MKRVVGIGGIFIKSNAPEELKAWYRTHLVMDPDGNRVELWEPPPGATEG